MLKYNAKCYMELTESRRTAVARIFKNSWFERFARKERIADASLREAVERAESGLVDADLGGGVIKQRVARTGQGKSGGYRTLILFGRETRQYSLLGSPKVRRRTYQRRTWPCSATQQVRRWNGAPGNWTDW